MATNFPMPGSWPCVLWYMRTICTDVTVEPATAIVKCRRYTLIMQATGSFEQSAYLHFIPQDIFLFTIFFFNSVVTLCSDVDVSYVAT